MAESKPLPADSKVRPEDLLYSHMFHPGEARVKWIAFGSSALTFQSER